MSRGARRTVDPEQADIAQKRGRRLGSFEVPGYAVAKAAGKKAPRSPVAPDMSIPLTGHDWADIIEVLLLAINTVQEPEKVSRYQALLATAARKVTSTMGPR
jgi:hypothetical protein